MYAHYRKKKSGEKQRFYSCKRPEPGATHVSIGAAIDNLVEAIFLKRVAQPDAVEALQQTLSPEDDTLTEQLQDLAGERNTLLARSEQIEDVIITAAVDISPFARASKKIEDSMSAIDLKMREVTATREADPLTAELSGRPDIIEWWGSGSFEHKRRLTRLLMEIHPLPA